MNAADGVVPSGAEDARAAPQSVSELAEAVGRDTATLAFRWAQVALSDEAPVLRRTARATASVAICIAAVLSAFVFGNWAVASALSSSLPGWRAPLVLAAAWLVVGGLVAALLVRGRLRGDRTATMLRRQRALDEAELTLRQTLDRLSDAMARAAEERIAAAILPLAGGMVDVGEDMVEATDEVLEAADEISDKVEDAVPGGVVVNRAVDLALVPGRFGVRVARSVLSFGRDDT